MSAARHSQSMTHLHESDQTQPSAAAHQHTSLDTLLHHTLTSTLNNIQQPNSWFRPPGQVRIFSSNYYNYNHMFHKLKSHKVFEHLNESFIQVFEHLNESDLISFTLSST